MRIQIPKSLRLEHEELHDFLATVRHEPGELGDTLRRVARLLEPHFRKEEAFALPPLGLLVRLARHDVNAAMAEVYPHTDWLKNNLPTLMAEHDAIGAAVAEMLQAARAAERTDYIEFAEKLVNHLRMEEEVMYPAAIVVGEYLRLLLGSNEGIAAL
jgi:iron-sulfur cluster repair protein YtfE (RIC family)